MDSSAEHPPTGDTGRQMPERRGSSGPRDERAAPAAGAPPRPAADTRRKRSADGRYSGWRDSLDREYCAHAELVLPATFPVASHVGVATIAMAVVARRDGALLLCNYSHCGMHAWPDGEVVGVDVTPNQAAVPPPGD
ncbi:MAG: hypothetical protein H0T18_01515 [Chloroflexia bacterium]|nr:hypothetical protein [Chloroflexia bacterium]